MKQKVNIIEVCPRDGFQNLDTFIPTETKLKVIDALIAAGFEKMQITSFVHPKAIPQMSDSYEVAKTILDANKSLECVALIPNQHGANRALEAGIRSLSYVISASESHNKANVNRTIEESFDALKELRLNLPEIAIKLDIATAFGCPFEGKISTQKIIEMIEKANAIGIDQVFLADTIGVASPQLMDQVLQAVKQKFSKQEFGLHLHDTRGMGLANIVIALQKGFYTFESAAGGLGGCPFAPGAAGNIATEDLVNMLNEMGYDTGIDLNKLLDAVTLIKKEVKSDLTGHLANICKS